MITMSIPSVTWHAGAMHTRANTIHSVKKAVACKAQIVELDVTFRPDGTPVIIHLAQPSMKQGKLLDDALAAVAESDSCRINLDLKAFNHADAVDPLVRKHGLLERVFYTGIELKDTGIIADSSEIPYYLNANIGITNRENADAIQALADKIKACGAIGLNTHYSGVSALLVEIMHKNGLLVSAWTANDTLTQKMLINAGVDNITTKRPDKLNRLLG